MTVGHRKERWFWVLGFEKPIYYFTLRFLYVPHVLQARCGKTDALQDLHTPVAIDLSASCERRLRPRVVDLR